GAGGAIGYRYVASQKADGYSLVWNSNSISTTYHSGLLPFDYQAFDAVARVLVESPVIAVRADSRWKSLNDLIVEARAKPKIVSVGHSGIGSHTHISLAALSYAAGAEVNEVPFGAAQVVPSLIGGHVDALVQLPAALSGPVKQGQVRLLAALIPNRDPALPDVPTAREQGFDVSVEAWRGIAVPHGTPHPVISVLEALADARGAKLGQDVVEALAAEVEGLGVGLVAEPEDAVAHAGQVRALGAQIVVQRPRVVRHVALAVGRGTDQKHAFAREHRAVELVHEERLDPVVAVVERQLHFLRAQLRRAGHGADEAAGLH